MRVVVAIERQRWPPARLRPSDPLPPPPAPADHMHVNWGDTKQKAVTRLEKPTNWFRQAPKAKSK